MTVTSNTEPFLAAADRYATAEFARTGASGLLLPKISLGLWNNFGDDRAFETQRAIVRRAFDLGVTHIDLANNYGPPPGLPKRTSDGCSPATSRRTATS